ncbi:MAG: DUF362 domain-containing protein [Candidatus Bathyarchaeia archaeon]
MEVNKVSVVRVGDTGAAVKRSVDLISGTGLKGGEDVIIKPNICNAKNPHGMVITDFGVLKGVVNLVKEAGASITIVESDNISGTAYERIEGSGLSQMMREWDVPFLNLSQDDYEEHEVAGNTIKLPKTVLEADYFINVPKIKTCAHTLVTLSIKNLYGVFQRADKNKLHKHLDDILPYLAEHVPQDLIVVDGITCMQGNGPVIGTPKALGLVVAGKNTVSVDSVCTSLMGYNPLDVTHIARSADLGIGEADINRIDVVGDDWTSFICEFDKPYSVMATLKSIKSIKDVYLG